MKVFAHRGNCREALENSWTAFRLSRQLGCDGIELDVHLTKDGHMAVIHDREMHRTAATSADLALMTRAEVEKVKLKNGEGIPFLEDVLEEFLPHMEVNVELKTYTRPMVEAFASYYKRANHKQNILLSAKSFRCLQHVNDLAPDCRTGYVLDTRKALLPTALLKPITDMVLKRLRLEAVHPIISMCEPGFVNFFKSRGIKINYWFPMAWEKSLPDPYWQKLIDLKADSIISNDPRALLAWLGRAPTK